MLRDGLRQQIPTIKVARLQLSKPGVQGNTQEQIRGSDDDDEKEKIMVAVKTRDRRPVHECGYCGSKFKYSTELNKHLDQVHIGYGVLQGNVERIYETRELNI
jgi:uncharacterized C2H2 Zn-finger protein